MLVRLLCPLVPLADIDRSLYRLVMRRFMSLYINTGDLKACVVKNSWKNLGREVLMLSFFHATKFCVGITSRIVAKYQKQT